MCSLAFPILAVKLKKSTSREAAEQVSSNWVFLTFDTPASTFISAFRFFPVIIPRRLFFFSNLHIICSFFRSSTWTRLTPNCYLVLDYVDMFP